MNDVYGNQIDYCKVYLLVTQVMKKTFINKSLFRSILEKEGKREGGIQLEILIDHQL